MNTSASPQSVSAQLSAVIDDAEEVAAQAAKRELAYAEQMLDEDSSHLHAIHMHYLHNLIKHTPRTSATAYRICHALEGNDVIEYADDYKGDKFPVKAKSAKSKVSYDLKDSDKKKVSEQDWALLQAHFAQYDKPVALSEKDVTYKNLMRLADVLGLQEVEKKSLEVLYTATRYSELESFLEIIFAADLAKTGIGFARMLDRPAEGRAFFNAIGSTSRLERFGVIYSAMSHTGNDSPDLPAVDEFILEKLGKLDMSDDEIVSVLLGSPCKAELKIEDFAHIGEPLEFALSLIKNASERGEKGVNILIYGPPGSGKTKLVEAIADQLNLRLFSVGEPNNEGEGEGDEMETRFDGNGAERSTDRVRVTQLLRTQALLEGSRDSLVLFDEIEDLLIKGSDNSKNADTQNKLQINRLLEKNPVVTIWTGNNPEKFQEFVRQRFAYSIYMDYQPTLVREKIWNRRLEMDKVTLPEQEVRDLARDYSAPPRMIAHAVKSMKIIGGGVDTVRESLSAASKMSYGNSSSILIDERIPQGFDLDFINADQDLHSLFNRLVQRGLEKKPFSLLMQTNQNMGSESLLHLMAEKMSMNPVEVSIGSLLVEQPMQPPPAARILATFDQAADSRQFLILTDLHEMAGENFKQVDGWDNPLVHFLTEQALKHKQPFAVTMRPDAKLPGSVALAFSDTVKISPISNDNASRLYDKVFGQQLPNALVEKLQELSAQDFLKAKTLLARLDMPAEEFDHEKVLDFLQRFKESRTAKPSRKMGF